jgi:predicted lipid-binding transport protein (Tim44 family)
LKAGYEPVIIHGDGHMFAGASAMEGSDHHKEYNSGVAEINKDEIISRAKFRAIYYKNSELPTTPEDIIQEFYDQQAKELQNVTKAEVSTNFANAITIEDPKPEVKEVKKPEVKE